MSVFSADHFDLEKWKAYMDGFLPGAKQLCLDDMAVCIGAGHSWEKDFLPVLDAVLREKDKRLETIRSFHRVTGGLDERIEGAFGRKAEAEVVLYLGLCSGAGWVTPVNGKTAVLLGIEKIMELGWCNPDDMFGLIVHELGHVYHTQHGARGKTDTPRYDFLWRLFEEGVATVFEQETTGDPQYYHQDRNGWKVWCDRNFDAIKRSFLRDLDTMTRKNQRYFGDWVSYQGYGDTGYYLGARFVRFLMERDSFDDIIMYGPEQVREGFEIFARADA